MSRSIKNLIAAILISMSGYLAWIEILPAYNLTSFLKNKILEKEVLIASRTEIINKVEELREESNLRYVQLQRLALVIPDEKGLPELITSIENIYSRSGIVLPELLLSSFDNKESAGIINIESTGSGTYNQVWNIFNYIEKNLRIIDVSEFAIGLKSEGGSEENPELSYTLKMQAYWLKPIQKADAGLNFNPQDID